MRAFASLPYTIGVSERLRRRCTLPLCAKIAEAADAAELVVKKKENDEAEEQLVASPSSSKAEKKKEQPPTARQ